MPTFRVLDDVEHVLRRPSVYAGCDYGTCEVETLVVEGGRIVVSRVALDRIALKAFDEVLVNALDCLERGKRGGLVEVELDARGFRVANDGADIPLGYDGEWGCHVPHALFGKLRSSCNYDDAAERTGGGVNGIGCKLANVMCARFEVEVSDDERHYAQAFADNMRTARAPVVTPLGARPKRTVRVAAELDATRCAWTEGTRAVCARRVYDAAACYPDARVVLDGAHLAHAPHAPYAAMYAGEVTRLAVPGYVAYVAEASGRGTTVSFVNGVSTPDHGAHVAQFARRMHEAVQGQGQCREGDEAQWRRFVTERLFVLLFARLDRPAFRGNEKSAVGAPLRPEPAKLRPMRATRVAAMWREWGESSATAALQRDERRRRKLTVEKLDDAAHAGTREAGKCTLILTEGDSAKSFALAGMAVVGRAYYGVFPLRGKVKNVRDSTAAQADANKELRALKTILGLSSGQEAQALRYGTVLIMTDQDVDGFHIKGLVLNFLDSQFPGLVGARLKVACMRTPIVKATVRGVVHEFFTTPSYEAFARAEGAAASAHVKYYKGLGTSTSAEARAYFSDLRRYVVRYSPDGIDRLKQLFAKGTIAARKESVMRALRTSAAVAEEARDAEGYAVQSVGSLVETELMLYSVDAVHRCMPSVVDGLKPSQRKVVWSMLRAPDAERKVAQLASYVAHDTAYHHGEASLQQAIVALAQDFVGSNNCALLEPIGQFGTRRAGGEDAASPRYIYTKLARVARAVFVAEDLPTFSGRSVVTQP
jgi:DNA topoisomerase-2